MRPLHALALAALTTFALGARASAAPLLEAEQLDDGPISELSFLLGDFRVEETVYNPDGTVVETTDTDVVQVRPALGGAYIMMLGASDEPGDEDATQFWLIAWHGREGRYIGSVFSDDDPDSGTARGPLEGDTLTLVADPFELPDGRTISFEISIQHADEGELNVTVQAMMGDLSFVRSRSVWRPIQAVE